MLAENRRGDQLLAVLTSDERDLSSGPPLTHAVMAVRRPADGRHLLVFDRFRQQWQFAGGLIDPGETPRACAVRELREEVGLTCPPETPRFVGVIKLLLQPSRFHPKVHTEHGALYAVESQSNDPFVPNDEIEQIVWWDEKEAIGPVSGIDQRLIAFAWPVG